MIGFQHQPWCSEPTGHIGKACDHRTAIVPAFTPEPSTIAELRKAITAYDAIEEPENCGCSPWPASGPVVDAARAVLEEWDRVAAVRNEAVKAALRDSALALRMLLPSEVAKLIEPSINEDCPMASKCRIGQPCEHYPPDHPLHVHADCCK